MGSLPTSGSVAELTLESSLGIGLCWLIRLGLKDLMSLTHFSIQVTTNFGDAKPYLRKRSCLGIISIIGTRTYKTVTS